MLTFGLLSLLHSPRTPKKLWEQHTAVEAMYVWGDLEGVPEQGQQTPE